MTEYTISWCAEQLSLPRSVTGQMHELQVGRNCHRECHTCHTHVVHQCQVLQRRQFRPLGLSPFHKSTQLLFGGGCSRARPTVSPRSSSPARNPHVKDQCHTRPSEWRG